MRVIRAEQLTRTGDSPHAQLATHCVYSAQCEIAGVAMELRTDLSEVARLFGLRYADHPPTHAPDFRYYVATARSGYLFWSDHAPAWRWSQGSLPADAVVFLADTVVLSAIIRFEPSLASMHAAGVEFRGIAAAIVDHSALAKTTALMACARRGMKIYSDERVLVRGRLVYPFLRRTSVRAAGARLLLADRDAFNETPELSVKTALGGDAIAEPEPLGALFILSGRKGSASVERIDAATALPAITRWFDARGDIMDRVTRAIALLRSIACFRLTVGSPDETAIAMAYAIASVMQ